MNNALKTFFAEKQPDKLFTYDEFNQYSQDYLDSTDVVNLIESELTNYEYSKINMHRTNRIQKNFKPNNAIMQLVKKIDQPQYWICISEDWCGDSAQNLPYIYSYIKENPMIDFKIILRDDNLEIIDNYFKEGNPRSIPKIVGFDKNGDELFIWGPRPKFAQNLVQQLKAEGYNKSEFNKELHLWYGRNRGKELEKELFALFSNL